MSTAPALSPDLIRLSIALARSLSAAARNWALYPPEHPAVATSDERFAEAVESLQEYLGMKPEAERVWPGRLEAARFYVRFYGKKREGKRVAYSPEEV